MKRIEEKFGHQTRIGTKRDSKRNLRFKGLTKVWPPIPFWPPSLFGNLDDALQSIEQHLVAMTEAVFL